MAERRPSRKITTKSSKQEMLQAYNELTRQLEERREAEATPEAKIEERATRKAVETADSLSIESIATNLAKLKSDVTRLLADLGGRLEEEVRKYDAVKVAVEAKERELEEIYEIRKAASSLTALLELQAEKKAEFEAEMAERKEALTAEIQTVRSQWDDEKRRQTASAKERNETEAAQRERTRAEYEYAFNREVQLARERFEDEKSKMERELQGRREAAEKELSSREEAIRQAEAELVELRKKAAAFPKDLETAVAREVKAAVERAQTAAAAREELLQKGFEGEKNVLATRIAALESKVAEQSGLLAKMGQQTERAYNQVQDIAVKAVEGSAASKAAQALQQFLAEQRAADREK